MTTSSTSGIMKWQQRRADAFCLENRQQPRIIAAQLPFD
jgi:hypothetical protein